ncbi:MAG: XkdF-like putative serine protease domain-containing protein [Campylobacteraceae bacterium]
MSKKRRLSDIDVSHISLVKAGANGKTIIYKSNDATPTYKKVVDIKKFDEEKGIVYGIVYEPEKLDSQGDMASADEIQKAAYRFMKQRNTPNVDKNHSFINEDAYVAESYIVKKGDPLFPECVGAWAVAIQLENEELRTAVKKGDINGLSMAGVAVAKDIEENDNKNILDTVKDLFVSISASFSKSNFSKSDLEKVIKSELEPILKERDELKNELLVAKESLKKTTDDLAAITKEKDELVTVITKSKQNTDPEKIDTSKVDNILSAAKELIAKEAELGNKLSISEAVTRVTKGE